MCAGVTLRDWLHRDFGTQAQGNRGLLVKRRGARGSRSPFGTVLDGRRGTTQRHSRGRPQVMSPTRYLPPPPRVARLNLVSAERPFNRSMTLRRLPVRAFLEPSLTIGAPLPALEHLPGGFAVETSPAVRAAEVGALPYSVLRTPAARARVFSRRGMLQSRADERLRSIEVSPLKGVVSLGHQALVALAEGRRPAVFSSLSPSFHEVVIGRSQLGRDPRAPHPD